MLLTLADGQGTSDEAWSDWKESLVWELYNASRTYLAEGEAAYLRNRRQRESQRRAVAGDLDASFTEEIDAHFHWMPERYFETFDAASIAGHLRLEREFTAQLYQHDDPASALLGIHPLEGPAGTRPHRMLGVYLGTAGVVRQDRRFVCGRGFKRVERGHLHARGQPCL